MTANRVIIGDYWGEPSTPHVSLNILGDDVWRSCVRRGGVRGLRRYVLGNSNDTGDTLAPAAIGLDYRVVVPDEWNTKANWGNASTLEELPNLFGDGLKSLMHIDAVANPAQPFVYIASHSILLDQAHTVRLTFAKLPEPEEDEPKQVSLWRYYWGNEWRLELREGSLSLQRFSEEYTTSLDQELDELYKLETTTSLQDARRGELESLIFELNESLTLPNGSEGEFHQGATITFIAEPRGVVRVECLETGEANSFEIPSLLGKRMKSSTDATSTRNVVWASSKPRIESYGGVFAWASGRAQWAQAGELSLGKLAPGFDAGEVPVRGQWDTPAGTTLSFTNEVVEDDPRPPLYVTVPPGPAKVSQFVARMTGNGLTTPFLYAAESFKPAGDRTGTDAVVWDSDDHLTFGTSALMDIAPQYEGENLRASWTVVLRVVKRQDGTHEIQNFPHVVGRTVDLWANDARLCRKGIIRSAVYNGMAQVETANEEDVALGISKPAAGATLTLEIGDPWTILDENVMYDDPIGDGRKLGSYLKTVFRSAGFTEAELTGISDATGVTLPSAALGETFAVRPTPGTLRGDYVRGLMEEYGLNLRLFWDNVAGTWRLQAPSLTVKAAFSSDAATNPPYRIEMPLDIVLDPSDFFNVITVQGANDAKGVPITRTWTLWESFRNENDWRYIGRRKRMQTIVDDALRTDGDVAIALRSVVAKVTRPFRFAQFKTWFIGTLFPGDRVTVDGALGEIERVGSGNIAGRMYMGVDEVRWSGNMDMVVRLLATQRSSS